MCVSNLMGEAERSALALINNLANVQETADAEFVEKDGFPGAFLPSLITFYVQFCPLVDDWQLPIRLALSSMRGVRPSRGFKFAGRRHGCAHEAVLASVTELQGWLGKQAAFHPIAEHLLNKHLGLFHHAGIFWHQAVERFVLAKCVDDPRAQRLADDPIYKGAYWKDCCTIYAGLVGNGASDGHTFTQVVRAQQPGVYHELAKALGKKASGFDLEALRRQVRWEAARAQLPGTPPPPAGVKPRWDAERGELWYGSVLAKKFKQRAQNQRAILDCFEEQGWPSRIDDPLPGGKGDGEQRQYLADALRLLNRNQAGLCFGQDGTGEGAIWSPPAEHP
jgi:hypothetical protein